MKENPTTNKTIKDAVDQAFNGIAMAIFIFCKKNGLDVMDSVVLVATQNLMKEISLYLLPFLDNSPSADVPKEMEFLAERREKFAVAAKEIFSVFMLISGAASNSSEEHSNENPEVMNPEAMVRTLFYKEMLLILDSDKDSILKRINDLRNEELRKRNSLP